MERHTRGTSMSLLIDETPDAAVWVQRTLGGVPMAESLGRLASAVIWTDSYLQDGEPIGGNDPSPIVDEINEQGLPLLHGHDPGRPAGRFIAAHAFTSQDGTQFVAAILEWLVIYLTQVPTTCSVLSHRGLSPQSQRFRGAFCN